MKSILLIEPDYLLAKIYRQSLKQAGFRVSHATNAQMAISLADSLSPDLVILELQLVEHSGIEFLYEFRSYPEWQNVPVIINSQVPPGEFSLSWPILKDDLAVSVYLYKPSTSLSLLIRRVNDHLAISVGETASN